MNDDYELYRFLSAVMESKDATDYILRISESNLADVLDSGVSMIEFLKEKSVDLKEGILRNREAAAVFLAASTGSWLLKRFYDYLWEQLREKIQDLRAGNDGGVWHLNNTTASWLFRVLNDADAIDIGPGYFELSDRDKVFTERVYKYAMGYALDDGPNFWIKAAKRCKKDSIGRKFCYFQASRELSRLGKSIDGLEEISKIRRTADFSGEIMADFALLSQSQNLALSSIDLSNIEKLRETGDWARSRLEKLSSDLLFYEIFSGDRNTMIEIIARGSVKYGGGFVYSVFFECIFSALLGNKDMRGQSLDRAMHVVDGLMEYLRRGRERTEAEDSGQIRNAWRMLSIVASTAHFLGDQERRNEALDSMLLRNHYFNGCRGGKIGLDTLGLHPVTQPGAILALQLHYLGQRNLTREEILIHKSSILKGAKDGFFRIPNFARCANEIYRQIFGESLHFDKTSLVAPAEEFRLFVKPLGSALLV